MRFPHILLIVLLLAASPSAHAGLVAHYRFDGDLKDATGRHDGRPVDATLAPAFAPGRAGSAVVIERANAGIEAANPSAIDFRRDFTIAAWVNVGCYYAECPVLFKGQPDKTTAPDKFFGLFGIEGLQVHGEGQGEWITNFRASDGLVPNDGGWHHVAVTYQAAQAPHFTLYVDGRRTTTEIGLRRGLRAEEKIVLSAPASASDRDVVQVSLRDGQGRELWHKTIRAMIVREAPELPAFGATETKLRYDYPLLSYSGPDEVTEIPYDQAWAAERKDVVVALPNGSRFVFWRGAAYTPFWAGKHNTALNFEFAEAPTRPDGVDCVDASSDKELRRSRVEILESTAARVHVRWTAQPCDLNYKVWGESVAEDFYFYPDGFGTRTMTLQCEPKAQYEIEELLILTPPAAYPLRVLPENLVNVLFRDGTKRELKFPILDQERDYEKLLSGEMPPLYRIRFNALDTASAVYFNPGWTRLPVQAYRPFYSQGQMVTPFYWGNHLPLARRKPTGHNIDERAFMTPAHNAPMTWGHRRPQPLVSRVADMPDALGVTRPMKVEKWAWLIGLSDAGDARLLEWSRSFAMPPKVEAAGARLQSPSYNTERRATLLTVEKPMVSLTITPATPCVHPVFELNGAPKTLARVVMNGCKLAANDYAWDGRTFWLNGTLREETTLRLMFGDQCARCPYHSHGDRSEVWISLSSDGGRSWSEPRFVFANAAAPNLANGWFNWQCSYLDAFTDNGLIHLFVPHRWQRCLHLHLPEAELSRLPTAQKLQ